ncbi:hypothetical protein CEQ90_00420 [Lewinellaceae bacterium SD302]|nr:hypothetical protein CEQ90_00420 [Lewinellaceae bacterium SD302]
MIVPAPLISRLFLSTLIKRSFHMNFFKSFLFITLLTFFYGGGLNSQVIFNGDCIDFEFNCTGNTASFPGAQVTTYCRGSQRVEDLTGNDDDFCWSDYIGCSDKRRGICLEYKNWHLCQDGSGSVYQSLPRNSSINGTVLGNYPLEPWSSNSSCVGRIYSTFNNNINSATELNFCDGDPVTLKVPGLEIPDMSGQGLIIRLRDIFGGTVVQTTILNSLALNGDEVDLTNFFTGVPNGTYTFEMVLSCTTGAGNCAQTPNIAKTSYIKLERDVFTADMEYSVLGQIFQNCPLPSGDLSPQPDGVTIDYDPTCHDDYFLSLDNIVNSGGEDIEYSLLRKVCSSSSDYESLGTGTLTAAEIASGATGIGVVPVNESDPECYCYRLDLTYTDICNEGGFGTLSGYYKIGENCPDLVPEPGGKINDQLGMSQTEAFDVFPNPVDDHLMINWQEVSTNQMEFIIFSSTGQIVRNVKVPIEAYSSYRLDLDLPAGAYHYNIVWDTGTQSGTFIKR